MKSPLLYLTAIKLKNQIKDVLKSPSKLIYGLFMIAMLALTVFSGSMGEPENGQYRDIRELCAMAAILYTFMFLLVFLNGSAGNNSMFTLSDVNMLFLSSLSPKRVLFYGLFRQLGLSLLLGLFLLFQYAWVHDLYGIPYGGLLLLIGGYALTLFLGQLCAMAVYVRTSGKDNAAKWIKTLVYGSAILYVLAALFSCREPLLAISSGRMDFEPLLSAGAGFFSSLPGLLFPVSGWAAAVAGGALMGDWALLAAGAALTLVFAAALVFLIVTAKNNYYEDVLQTAETSHSAITAQKEGQVQEVVPKHVKVGKTGLGKGWGASAVYYKHKVENRRSGVLFFSPTSLIFAVIVIAFSVFLRGEAGGGALIGAFFMGTYMQMFSVSLGRFSRELTKPYLYLIPEPPLKKLLHAIQESMVSEALEAVLIFVPVGLILGASPLDTVLCVLARISFSLLFTAGNFLVERVFGTVSSKALIFFFYFLVLLLLCAPGIVLGVVLTVFWGEALGLGVLFLGILPLNILVSLLVLYLCRNVLQYAELNNR